MDMAMAKASEPSKSESKVKRCPTNGMNNRRTSTSPLTITTK